MIVLIFCEKIHVHDVMARVDYNAICLIQIVLDLGAENTNETKLTK